jgi:hypothetical protein
MTLIERLRALAKGPSIFWEAADAIESLQAENEQLRIQLAGCGVAAMQNTESSKAQRVQKGSYGWSGSYGDVCRAVDREIELRTERDALAAKLVPLTQEPVGYTDSTGKAFAVKWSGLLPPNITLYPAPKQAQEPVSDVAHMVNRFLGWKLPREFAPDGGITFHRKNPKGFDLPHCWPVGTNLLTTDQARAMFEYCLQGAAPQAQEQKPVVKVTASMLGIFPTWFDPEWHKVARWHKNDVWGHDRQVSLYAHPAPKQAEPTDLAIRIKAILEGIDQDEFKSPDGWWETAAGAEFGANKLKLVLEAINKAAPKQAKPSWQPIESAPKDGTEFLGLRGNKIANAYRVQRDDCEMWSFGGSSGDVEIAPHTKPTHWMPLPKTPKETL